MKDLTHLSLFTGIGGLDLAAEWAGFKTVGQCEFADYPIEVLKNHWPDVWRCKDIHDLRADEFYRQTGIRGGITVISGGFPCQPHSVAGKRKASCDERDLWPEYRRVIDEFKPRWVVAENVRGLLSSEDGRFFRGILRDFANLGYDVGWCCYRAADVGAIHPRERIFVIAHARSERMLEQWFEKYTAERDKTQHGTDRQLTVASDTNRIRLEGSATEAFQGQPAFSQCAMYGDVEEWTRRCNTFEPKLLRNSNGVPGQMDRIKALGNSVMPQQGYLIFKAIAELENFV